MTLTIQTAELEVVLAAKLWRMAQLQGQLVLADKREGYLKQAIDRLNELEAQQKDAF